MITDFFLRVLYDVATFVLNALNVFDDFSLSSDFLTSFTTAVGYANALVDLLPITTLYICLGVLLTVEIGINSFKGIMFIVKKIPGLK